MRCDDLMWTPLDCLCSNGPVGKDYDPYCLYDIVNDPSERKDLAGEKPRPGEDVVGQV